MPADITSTEKDAAAWLESTQENLRELIEEMTTLVVHGAKADPKYVGTQLVSVHAGVMEALRQMGAKLPEDMGMYPEILLDINDDDDDEYEI